jgi:hypothetical protein
MGRGSTIRLRRTHYVPATYPLQALAGSSYTEFMGTTGAGNRLPLRRQIPATYSTAVRYRRHYTSGAIVMRMGNGGWEDSRTAYLSRTRVHWLVKTGKTGRKKPASWAHRHARSADDLLNHPSSVLRAGLSARQVCWTPDSWHR